LVYPPLICRSNQLGQHAEKAPAAWQWPPCDNRHHGYGEERPADVISDHRHIIAALAAHGAASLATAHAAKAEQELIARMLAKDVVASSAVA
jgi:hypothetical protein